jgi:hypothetical protein
MGDRVGMISKELRREKNWKNIMSYYVTQVRYSASSNLQALSHGVHHSAHEANMSTSPDADGASGAFLKKAGWLKKKSPGGFLGIAIWQSRYVVVDEETETLKYFRTMEDADAGKAG